MLQSDVANLVELIPYAALLYSGEETILAANGLFCDLLGYAPAELATLRAADLSPPGDNGRDADARAQLRDGRYLEVAYEKRFIHKDGRHVPCEMALKRVADGAVGSVDGGGDGDGEYAWYLALVRTLEEEPPNDIILDSLHGASELLLHAIDEGFILLDSEFRIRSINDEALRIDGRPRSSLIGLTHWEAWPGSEHLPLADAYRKAVRERVHVSTEQLFRHDGEGIWLEVRAFPFGDSLAVFYKNITQRKLAEKAIRDSESKFRTIADAIPQIVWSARPDGFHDYFNRQWYDYTGAQEGSTDGEGWLQMFHPDDWPALQARWQHCLASGEPYEIEYRIRHHTGGYRWTLGRALPVRNKRGDIVRWMGTCTDIHERIVTQAALSDTQSRLQAALNAAQIGTWSWDIEADQVHADENMAAMFGMSEQSANGGPMADYFKAIHPDDAGRVHASLEHALATGEPCHERFRMRENGDGIRYMESRSSVVAGGNGKPQRMAGAVLDVTRQRRAEEAVQINQSKFRTLAENIPQLAWMADRNGDIFWCNSRWFEYTGMTFEELQEGGWQKVHHPDHLERIAALYRERIVVQQRTWEETFPLRGADGQYRWFLSRAVPIRDADGNVVRWLGTNTDITLQRETEEALHQANQRKDDFLAMLAHELRNPLAPIVMAAQLLKNGARNPDNIQRSSEIIDRQVRHLSGLIDDLLDVSRVTRGLVTIERDEVSIATVVHTALEQSRPLIDARRQILVVDIRDGGGIVLGDSRRLVQVLVNLLNNAAKYTPQRGRIALTVTTHDGQADIVVADNGIGMDAALLPHVFELFTQAERTPDRSEGGLGLGLALVKSIVALHGGKVSAASPGPGRGSTFTVSLPLLPKTPDDAAGTADSPSSAAAPQPLHILVVDRAEDGGAALPAQLQAEGHVVALCPDEACALNRARELHPDAVLIRTDLPGVEGYALARQLRALDPEQRTTIIALNGSGQSHDKVIARGAGFDHQLERPVALASLKRVLPERQS